MNSSEGSLVVPALINTFWRTAYGYALVVAALLAFPMVPALADYGAAWYWLLVPAVLLHGMYLVSAMNDPATLRKLRERQSRQGEVKLDSTRQAYMNDIRNRRDIVNQRIAQTRDNPSLAADMAGMVSELDRLVPELERLLSRNQQLQADIQRLQASPTAQPSQQSLTELKDLYKRQWDVIKRVSGEVATFDANLAIVINKFDDQSDTGELDSQIKEWSSNLTVWKDSIQQVYG